MLYFGFLWVDCVEVCLVLAQFLLEELVFLSVGSQELFAFLVGDVELVLVILNLIYQYLHLLLLEVLFLELCYRVLILLFKVSLDILLFLLEVNRKCEQINQFLAQVFERASSWWIYDGSKYALINILSIFHAYLQAIFQKDFLLPQGLFKQALVYFHIILWDNLLVVPLIISFGDSIDLISRYSRFRNHRLPQRNSTGTHQRSIFHKKNSAACGIDFLLWGMLALLVVVVGAETHGEDGGAARSWVAGWVSSGWVLGWLRLFSISEVLDVLVVAEIEHLVGFAYILLGFWGTEISRWPVVPTMLIVFILLLILSGVWQPIGLWTCPVRNRT